MIPSIELFRVHKTSTEQITQLGLEPNPAIVVAGDWMATGPMVEMAFPTFVVTGNPQREIVGREPRIILAEVFSKITNSKVVFPFGEADIHKTVAGTGVYARLLNNENYDSLIKSKIQQMVDKGASYVFPYQCFTVDFEFFEKFGLKVMGPRNLSIRDLLANKIHFYEFLNRCNVESIPGKVVNSVEEATELTKEYGEVYITEETGAGGVGSYHLRSPEEVSLKLAGYEGRMLVLKWMRKVFASQNVLAIVPRGGCSPSNVAVVSVSDQIIYDTLYGGNRFPTRTPKKQFDELVKMTKILGAELSKNGYAGIFGLDALTIKDKNKLKVYPVELNLRVNHSHGLAAFIYNKLRPDMPPIALIHAMATLTDQWLGNKELRQLPIRPEEMPHVSMDVARMKGWLKTNNFSLSNSTPIGFPPSNWLVPQSDIDSKSGMFIKGQPLFIGRLITQANNSEALIKKSDKSKKEIENKYERMENVHDWN